MAEKKTIGSLRKRNEAIEKEEKWKIHEAKKEYLANIKKINAEQEVLRKRLRENEELQRRNKEEAEARRLKWAQEDEAHDQAMADIEKMEQKIKELRLQSVTREDQ